MIGKDRLDSLQIRSIISLLVSVTVKIPDSGCVDVRAGTVVSAPMCNPKSVKSVSFAKIIMPRAFSKYLHINDLILTVAPFNSINAAKTAI